MGHKAGQRHHGRFGTPEEEKGGWGGGGGNQLPESQSWRRCFGACYTPTMPSEVVSQSPEQLRKMMGVIVVVCAAFGLIVSEAKTEIMCLRTKGMPETTATFSLEAAG